MAGSCEHGIEPLGSIWLGDGDFSTEELLSSQEGLFSIGLDIIGLHDRDEFLRT